MKELEQLFDSFKPVTNFLIAMAMALIAHLGTITSVIALVVLLYQLRVVYYKGKREKIAYDKECKGK